MPLQVVLDHDEMRWASDIAVQRIDLAEGDPRFEYSGSRDGLNTHALGCMGELAFAKALGLEWPAHVGTYRTQPDVFPFWEVRWSSRLNRAKVAIDDPAYYLVAHVTGHPPGFEVWGYVIAGWAQQNIVPIDLPDKDGKPRGRKAHFVDTYKLSPIEPGFHANHFWANGYGGYGGWSCIVCGEAFDGEEAA